ncbi:Uncharacterized protein TCM_012603 [Theobroma cacao]|uniref:Uncharacterized protein n=1 Tax=Theobroma cacao TaxID=3641 RepID=A0A061FVY4_THECC|nr:Uncharacterized protein TCM_012603 [Theobroma cacao]
MCGVGVHMPVMTGCESVTDDIACARCEGAHNGISCARCGGAYNDSSYVQCGSAYDLGDAVLDWIFIAVKIPPISFGQKFCYSENAFSLQRETLGWMALTFALDFRCSEMHSRCSEKPLVFKFKDSWILGRGASSCSSYDRLLEHSMIVSTLESLY